MGRSHRLVIPGAYPIVLSRPSVVGSGLLALPTAPISFQVALGGAVATVHAVPVALPTVQRRGYEVVRYSGPYSRGWADRDHHCPPCWEEIAHLGVRLTVVQRRPAHSVYTAELEAKRACRSVDNSSLRIPLASTIGGAPSLIASAPPRTSTHMG